MSERTYYVYYGGTTDEKLVSVLKNIEPRVGTSYAAVDANPDTKHPGPKPVQGTTETEAAFLQRNTAYNAQLQRHTAAMQLAQQDEINFKHQQVANVNTSTNTTRLKTALQEDTKRKLNEVALPSKAQSTDSQIAESKKLILQTISIDTASYGSDTGAARPSIKYCLALQGIASQYKGKLENVSFKITDKDRYHSILEERQVALQQFLKAKPNPSQWIDTDKTTWVKYYYSSINKWSANGQLGDPPQGIFTTAVPSDYLPQNMAAPNTATTFELGTAVGQSRQSLIQKIQSLPADQTAQPVTQQAASTPAQSNVTPQATQITSQQDLDDQTQLFTNIQTKPGRYTVLP